MNKRGIVMAMTTWLIFGMMALAIIVALTIFFGGAIIASASSLSCGGNVALRGMSIAKEAVQLFACHQYEKVEEVIPNAYEKCSNLNTTICSDSGYKEYAELYGGEEDDVKVACQEQCARLQFDKYATDCWNMAGAGRWDLVGPVREIPGSVTGWKIKNHILKCFRVRVPLGKDAKGNQFWFNDMSGGNSSNYGYEYAQGLETKTLGISKGGVEPALNVYLDDSSRRSLLNYNYGGKYKICYISYLAQSENQNAPAIIRSCQGWTGDLEGNYAFLN